MPSALPPSSMPWLIAEAQLAFWTLIGSLADCQKHGGSTLPAKRSPSTCHTPGPVLSTYKQTLQPHGADSVTVHLNDKGSESKFTLLIEGAWGLDPGSRIPGPKHFTWTTDTTHVSRLPLAP